MLPWMAGNDGAKTHILTHSLGSKAEVFSSIAFGVELELQEGSLGAGICEPVTVASEVRIVRCSDERDTSR